VISGTAFNFNGRKQAGMGADWGDLDGDGRPDLVVTTFARETYSLYRNEGAGLFEHVSFRAGFAEPTIPYVGWGVRFLDCDNDGVMDIVLANGHVRYEREDVEEQHIYEQPLQLFRGVGGGRVREETAAGLGPPLAGRGVSVGDVDNDGYPDVAVSSIGGLPRLLRNTGARSNAWIGFQLEGRESNRMALGARVTVTAGGKTQVREVTTAGSYLSAGDPRLLFGLGDAARAESVEIRWPRGKVQRLSDVPARQYHRYVEP
jgi:hypothetical protein